jgi:hypothetical protein
VSILPKFLHLNSPLGCGKHALSGPVLCLPSNRATLFLLPPVTVALPLPASRHARRRHPQIARGRRGRRVPCGPRRGGAAPPQAPPEPGARLVAPPRGRGAPPPRLRGGGEAAGPVQARARGQLLLPVQTPATPECSAGKCRRRGTPATASRCAHSWNPALACGDLGIAVVLVWLFTCFRNSTGPLVRRIELRDAPGSGWGEASRGLEECGSIWIFFLRNFIEHLRATLCILQSVAAMCIHVKRCSTACFYLFILF